jgi:excinuclease ABC subunit C
VLEALILEANLVHSYKPKANTDLKDDKSFNYVVITKEDFPRVLVVRGKELAEQNPLRRSRAPVHLSGAEDFGKPLHTFGPFPHGMQLKEGMKIIRRIFPYRDTCEPTSGKRCFNAQLGLCPGVCSGEISKKEYKKIIKRISLFFKGKKKELMRSLEKDMKTLAKEERFEEASKLRKQMFALGHIQDVSLIKEEYRSPTGVVQLNSRIEAYDVAHLGGSATVGVMVVVEDGVAHKNEYRKFKIRAAKAGDDTGALREILSRRLGHDEWPMPRLVVVDGATAHINAAETILRSYGVHIPVVGVVKDEKHRPREIRGDTLLIGGRERAILLANAEAHRFAIQYHRTRSRKSLLA